MITLVPSANWEMKHWPVSYWKELVALLPEYKFVILAGPKDTFCEEIRSPAPERVVNLAGQTSLMESSYIVLRSNLVISADTGFMHAADLFRVPAFALMGPTRLSVSLRDLRWKYSKQPCLAVRAPKTDG